MGRIEGVALLLLVGRTGWSSAENFEPVQWSFSVDQSERGWDVERVEN